MSRASALHKTLQLPLGHSLEVVSVPASGDCFYDCIAELLLRDRDDRGPFSVFETALAATSPFLRGLNSPTPASVDGDGGGGGRAVPSSQFLRNYVAERLTSEQLKLYKMYAAAGLGEYDFATNQTLEQLKQFTKRSGRANGPGKCFWADEFALRTLSEGLRLTLLIIDDQAARGMGNVGRKRRRNGGNDESLPKADNRFVFIGSYLHAVILHRSRRQHYNAVVVDNRPVMELEWLPSSLKSLWPVLGRSEQRDAKPEPAKGELGDGSSTKGKEKTVEFTSDAAGKGLPACREDSNQKPESSNVPEGNKSTSHLTSTNSSSSSTLPPTQALGNFYCGCAGFSSSSWVGNFYPKSLVGNHSDRQLDHYQQHFRAVEINSTFYGIPTESTVGKWKKTFAKSFRVVVKTPKGLMHEQTRLDCSVLSTFLSRMRPLGENLACILIQCPRTLAVAVDQLERLKAMMDEEATWYKGRVAFEFRNQATYDDDEVRRFLRRSNFVLVMHPDSLGRSTVGTSASGRGSCPLLEYEPEKLSKVAAAGTVTSDIVYLRLHGFNDEHRGEYTLDQLKEIATQIHSWRVQGLEVFCFFLNEQRPSPSPRKSPLPQPWDGWCAMPKNAKQLESLVYELSNDVVPDAPKKPKSTLLNFFGKKKG